MNRSLILLCIFLFFTGILTGEDISTVKKLAAQCTTGNQEACKKLADIARNDKDSNVRKAAVKMLPDGHQLRQIVLASEKDVRKITDEALLADIAKSAVDFNAGKLAVKKLSDQTLLADIAMSAAWGSVAKAAIEKLTDQTVLAEIARIGRNFSNEIRMAAIKKVSDQILLAEIACTDKNEDVIDAALSALRKTPKPLSAKAIEWLQQPLKEKWNDLEKNARKAIIEGIPEESWPVVLAEPGIVVVTSDRGLSSLQYYVKIRSSVDLRSIAHGICPIIGAPIPPGPYTFVVYYDYISLGRREEQWSQNFLSFSSTIELDGIYLIYSGVVGSNWNPGIKLICKGEECVSVAKNYENPEVRSAAVEKLTDQAVLADIARNDKESEVRSAAERRLKALQLK